MRVEAVMELMFLSSSSWKILRTSEAQLPATPNYICHILCYYSGYIQITYISPFTFNLYRHSKAAAGRLRLFLTSACSRKFRLKQ